MEVWSLLDFPGGSDGKVSAYNVRDPGFDPWVRKISWRRTWKPTPLFLPGKSHGERSLASYSSWGCKESDSTEVTANADEEAEQQKLSLMSIGTQNDAFSLENAIW